MHVSDWDLVDLFGEGFLRGRGDFNFCHKCRINLRALIEHIYSMRICWNGYSCSLFDQRKFLGGECVRIKLVIVPKFWSASHQDQAKDNREKWSQHLFLTVLVFPTARQLDSS